MPNILLLFSGGFDSTVLLSCLQTAPSHPRVVCLHYYMTGLGEDDREYARNVARHFDVELIEEYMDGSKVNFPAFLDFSIDPDPRDWGYTFMDGGYGSQLATNMGLDVLMNGQGGDELFNNRPINSAADYVYWKGLDLGFFGEARSIAQVENRSYLSVISEAITSLFRPPIYSFDSLLSEYSSDLIPKAIRDTAKIDPVTSWLQRPLEGVSASKVHQVMLTSLYNGFYIPNHREWDTRLAQPLYSQPIRELLYQIPTYMFGYRGIRRGLARMAFADMAPQKNIMRQSKSGAESHVNNIVTLNHGLLQDFLGNSLLVANGIWDKSKVEDVLSGHFSKGGTLADDIIIGLGHELWLKKIYSLI